MKLFKKIFRIIILTLILMLASTGMVGIFPNYRDRYMHKETTIELVEKKRDDNGNEQE
jgi:hypothetical protein